MFCKIGDLGWNVLIDDDDLNYSKDEKEKN